VNDRVAAVASFAAVPPKPVPARVLGVVVVYERDLDDVKAWSFLREGLVASADAGNLGEGRGFHLEHVLIYDNSPQSRARPPVDLAACTYVHDASNGGTAAAYLHACGLAGETGIDWMLLLDQDTSLPAGFLAAASTTLASSRVLPRALVPWVFHGSSVVSPARVTDTGTIAPLHYGTPPPSVGCLTAISSGSLLHAPTLAAHMPLPGGLWLDYVDHWIFLQLGSRGLPVTVFDASLQHDLSVSTVKSLSPARLTSILNGEACFLAMLGTKARLVYPFRLAARVLRYAWTRPDLAMHTLKWLVDRMRHRV